MICSIDRPVTVADLMELGQQRGWPNNDLSYWIGRRPKDCANYVQDDRTHPGALVDHDVALVARWLDRFPGTMMPQTAVTPRDMLLRLRGHLPGKRMSADWFATALGRHPSIGSRWCRTNALPHPTVRRAIALIDDPDPEVLCANWNMWCEHAVLEAELRGTRDLRATFRWNACRFPRAEQVDEAA